jgi:hypothetical protein
MWLALLASVVGDAVTARERRAATHELARRLGVGWKEERTPPSLQEVLRRLVEEARTVEDAMALLAACRFYALDDSTSQEPQGFPHVSGDLPTSRRIRFSDEPEHPWYTPIFPWIVRVWRVAIDTWADLVPDPAERNRLFPNFVAHHLHIMSQVQDWVLGHTPAEVLATPPGEATQRAVEWHRALAIREAGAPRPGVVVARFLDGARIERLLTRAQLDAEGKAMGHCVGTHHASVTDMKSAVFSYRNAEGMPMATAEVSLPYRPYGVGAELLDLEGPENGNIGSGANRRIGRWLEAMGVELGDFALKVNEEPLAKRRLVTARLFGRTEALSPDQVPIETALWTRQAGPVGVAMDLDAEMAEAIRTGQSAEALSALTRLMNVLDLGTIAYLRVPRLVSRDEPRAGSIRVPVLGFDYGGGLDAAIEGQIGRTRSGECSAVLFLRSLDTDEPETILGEGPTVLAALDRAGLLETIHRRAVRLERANETLEADGLVALVPFETALATNAATVTGAALPSLSRASPG